MPLVYETFYSCTRLPPPPPLGFQPLRSKTNEFSPENDVGRSPQILAAVLFFHQVRGRPYAVFILAVLRISFEIPRVRFKHVVRTAFRAQRHYHFRASLRLGQRPWPIVVKTFVVCNTGWVNGGGGDFFQFYQIQLIYTILVFEQSYVSLS